MNESQNYVSDMDAFFFLTDLKETVPFYNELVKQGVETLEQYINTPYWEYYRIDDFCVVSLFLKVTKASGYDFEAYELPDVEEYGLIVAKAKGTETLHFPFWKNYPEMHRAISERCKDLNLNEHCTPVELFPND